MSFYPPAVQKRFDSPCCAKIVNSANAEGISASFLCGSFVAFALRIDANMKIISDAGFRSNGCGYMIAAADALAEMVTGQYLSELHGLNDEELKSKVGEAFPGISNDRRQCINVCIEALRRAFSDFRVRLIEEFRGENALVCTCFGVTEE